jgi:predicted DCC family thiol-disulfide oxidoreductase YuxK
MSINYIAILEISYHLSSLELRVGPLQWSGAGSLRKSGAGESRIFRPPESLGTVMARHDSTRSELEVWIDGSCPICRRAERWCTNRDRERRLRFVDLHALTDPNPPGSFDEMMRTVHVRLPDGRVDTGFGAWRRILSELTGWRWIAWVAGLPGIRRLGSLAYSVVAGNRHRLP